MKKKKLLSSGSKRVMSTPTVFDLDVKSKYLFHKIFKTFFISSTLNKLRYRERELPQNQGFCGKKLFPNI